MSSKKATPQARNAFIASMVDYEALERICQKLPNIYPFYGLVNTKIHIPNDLYHMMHDFYGRALGLAEAMQTVLEDGEHQLIYEEACATGRKMPDLDIIKAELADYRDFLRSFDAYKAEPFKNSHVKMDPATLQGHRETIIRSNVMLKRLWQGCFETDYMDYFTTLKEDGVPYAGQTALQQMMNVAIGFVKADKANDKYQRSRMMQKHWPEFSGA
jgi:hypothetical protein